LQKNQESTKEHYSKSQKLKFVMIYRVSQNSRIPNSERGREGPSGARKIRSSWRRYKHINFVQYIAAFRSTVTKYYYSYVAVPFLRKIAKI
jgi:hypothetical protein